MQDFRNKLTNGNEYEGEKLSNVVAEESLTNERKRIVQSVTDCIQNRLEHINDDPLYLSCHIFDTKNWPDKDDRQALMIYGREELQLLYDHFSVILSNAGCDIDSAKNEWKDLKLYVARNDHFRGKKPLSIWQRVSQEDIGRDEYKNILLIIHFTGVYPLSNASCERAFSVMKRIKDDWRCSLSTERMDQLMRINISQTELQHFDPKPAVKRWWLSGQRARRPSILPYGQRP